MPEKEEEEEEEDVYIMYYILVITTYLKCLHEQQWFRLQYLPI